ncbi:MAG TPA: hypothetical protein VLM76_08605 [Patescibacteria group bacterium]|nr:hypothetical protein [Patescibacteria group bacterium]
MADLSRATRGTGKVGAILACLVLVSMLLPGAVLAATTITPATGGSAISADTASPSPGTGAWTALGGPVVTDGNPGDIPNTGTVTLTLSGSFEFRTAALGGAVGAAFTAAAGACGLTATTPVVAALTITTTLAGTATTGGDRCRLTFSGIQVRPTVGTLPNTGALAFSGVITGAAGSVTMVVGAPILTFTQQPSSTATAGTAFPAQPIVQSLDRFGNVRVADPITLAIKSGTGTVGAILTCTTNPVNTDGTGSATFLGCRIDRSSPAGNPYVLRATTGAAVAESAAITVSPGTPTRLVFTTQPARGTPGGAFAVQPVVAIQDAHGNTVTTASATVTLAIGANPGGGGTTLLCTANPLSTTNGVATFSGCRINNVGVGYTLTASDGAGLTDPTSTPFDVADRLVFAVQPSTSATAGVAFATQPIVHVRAGPTSTAVNDGATVVTLSLKPLTGTAGATLTCDAGLSRTVIAGIATFSGCRIDRTSPVSPANPYVIVASATGLSPAESTAVRVDPGAAARLGFTAQPTAAISNQPFPIQPVVAVQDLGGNTVTSGVGSTATVTLAIGVNPAGGTLTCTGGLTRVAVAGVATFTGCQINNAGVGYTLTATATGLTMATSTAFTVGAPVAAITLTTSSPLITWGSGIVLTTHFGGAGANRPFLLQRSLDNVTWITTATLMTDTTGRSAFSFRPATNFFYRAVFAGAADLLAATTPSVRTVVRQAAVLRPTNFGAVRTISRNTSIAFTTRVRPARPELPLARVTYRFFWRTGRPGSTWALISERTVTADSAGIARTSFRFTRSGQWYVRSRALSTPFNANSLWTPVERYNVR